MTHFSNIKEDYNDLKFNIKNNDEIKLGLANAIRRIIISQVPTFAIDLDSITFDENTSMLHDSYLAIRLGLLPINYENIKDYDIENINVSLDIKNSENYMINVYSKDFNVEYNGNTLENFFIDDNILFAKLKPEQSLRLHCKIGKSNAELSGTYHSAVCKSIVTYEKDDDKIESITKDMNDEAKQKFLNVMGETYYLKNKNNEPDTYVFNIESIGMIKPKTIVEIALSILKERLKIVQTALNENNDRKIKVDENTKLFQSYDFTIIDENHTLGNLISSYLLDNPEINYSGYIIPHPNDNKMVITTETKNDNTLEGNKKVFLETLQHLIDLTEKLQTEWETANKEQKPTVKKITIKKSK